MKHKRVEFELLRIIAIICVLANHTGANQYITKDVFNSGLLYYIPFLVIETFVRIGVPIFFMISGSLLGDRIESKRDLYKKRILHYILIIVFFSLIQFLIVLHWGYIDYSKETLYEWIGKIYSSQVVTPYWFLYAYLSLMIMLPLLRKMLQNMDRNDYTYMFKVHLILVGLCGIVQWLFKADINLTVPLVEETSIFYFFTTTNKYVTK